MNCSSCTCYTRGVLPWKSHLMSHLNTSAMSWGVEPTARRPAQIAPALLPAMCFTFARTPQSSKACIHTQVMQYSRNLPTQFTIYALTLVTAITFTRRYPHFYWIKGVSIFFVLGLQELPLSLPNLTFYSFSLCKTLRQINMNNNHNRYRWSQLSWQNRVQQTDCHYIMNFRNTELLITRL